MNTSFSDRKKPKRCILSTETHAPEPESKQQSRLLLTNQLSKLGISHEQTGHHDILMLSDTIKKKIYSQFIDIDQTYRCMHCRQWIEKEHLPIGLPLKLQPITKKICMEGSFCSLNCMVSHWKSQTSVKYRESGIILHRFMTLFFPSVQLDEMELPLPWSSLKEFGGNIEYTDWKPKHFYTLDQSQKTKWKEHCLYTTRLYVEQ